MKKLLIATTALVLTAGAAAAEVKVTGDARFGLRYNDAATINGAAVVDSFIADYRARVTFTMTGKTDGGLDFGAKFRADQAALAVKGGAGTAWIGGTWGKVTVGSVDTGSDSVDLGIAEIGYNGIGVDDFGESLYAESSANIAYTGSFGAFSVGLSYNLPTSYTAGAAGDWSLGVGYSGDGFNVALGYDVQDGGVKTLSVGGGVTMGAVSAHLLYSMPDAGDDAYGFDVGYKLNSATTLTAAYSTDGTMSGYGVGVAYNLGGGAKLIAGIGQVERLDLGSDGLAGGVGPAADFIANDTKAEVGLTFTF